MSLENLPLIRIGVYSQMEGSFDIRNFRFRLNANQIPDIRELIRPYRHHLEFSWDKMTVASFNSEEVYLNLRRLGFEDFTTENWNVPYLPSYRREEKAEYLRAVIDSLGNVDIDDKRVPYVQLSSINSKGVRKLRSYFGGYLNGPYQNRRSNYLRWKGHAAKDIFEYVNWRFNNPRNQRGLDMIEMMNWGEYVG